MPAVKPPGSAGRNPRSGANGRGAASLSVLLLLMVAMLLVAAWAQRNAMNEWRIAINQVRSAVAFEAAESGLAWAQVMLNEGSALGSDCEPSLAPGADSFRRRYLGTPEANGRYTPRSLGTPGNPAPLQMLCARRNSGWTCHCPDTAAPSLTVIGDDPIPSFLVQFSAAARPGAVNVTSIGCNHLARPCLPDALDRVESSARLRITLALLPAVSTPPAAALTALGDVSAGAAALGLHNADALSGGLAVQAGGRIDGSALRVHTAPGAPAAAALLAQDAALAGLTPAQLFSRHFGTDLVQWMQQPGVQRLDCRANCAAQLQALIAAETQLARIGLNGGLQLSGSVQIGSPARPVLLVVDGALELDGAVQIHGLVYARSLRWNVVNEGAGGLVHGALLLSQDYAGNGAPDIVYDPRLMATLKHGQGSWVRLPGSWRDF